MATVHRDEESLARLAVVGCGGLSTKRIFPCFPRLPVRLVGVCDLDEARAHRNARRHGGEAVFTNFAEMLDRTRPDGVVICIGPEAHTRLALEALERGVPVYTEKPPSVSAAEAWRVARASRKSGKLCMTAFKYRYAPAQVKARKIIDSPEFGGLSSLSGVRFQGPYKHEPGNPRSEFLLDSGIHSIDVACYHGGEVAEAFAYAPTPDNFAISLRFTSGAVGSLLQSCRGAGAHPYYRAEMTGASGHRIYIEDQIYMRYYVGTECRAVHEPRFCTAGGDSMEETGFLPELRAFVEHLRGERKEAEIPSRIEESAKSMALYEAIKRSAASGKPERPERFE